MRVRTHIMFQGQALAALDLYSRVFDTFKIVVRQLHGSGDEGEIGTLKTAEIDFQGHQLIFIDSPPVHDFDFTPSTSLFVDLPPDRFDTVYAELSEEGKVMMPPDDYGFSQRFVWICDRFGLSWQINVSVNA